MLDYFSALRLLVGTYTYCGSHTVESRMRKGETVIFFDWGSALGYCDDLMHKTLEINIPENTKLRWLRTRDERTRGIMAQLINEGWPGAEALQQAMVQTAHVWEMGDQTTAVPAAPAERRTQTRSPPPRHRDDRGRGQKSGGKNKGGKGDRNNNPLQGVRQAHIDGRGQRICNMYNSKRGCSHSEAQCPRG